MDDVLLSIAIPTFNRKALLLRLLNSILKNSLNGIEIIISDNHSNDGTKEYFEMLNDSRIRYIYNHENLGFDRNYLQCCNVARGKYVWIIGSDDIVSEDAVSNIFHFLNHNKVDLLFINHSFFSGIYDENKKYDTFLDPQKHSFVTENKSEFIRIVNKQITFLSALIFNKDKVKNIADPAYFCGTFFIHTCLAFCVTKEQSSKMGIIFKPLLMDDLTPSNSSVESQVTPIFTIFGRHLRHVFLEIASQCSYPVMLMRKIYFKTNRYSIATAILKAKVNNIDNWKRPFWEDGYPAVKDDVQSRMLVLVAYLCPRFIACFLINKVRPLYRTVRCIYNKISSKK